MTHMDHSTLDLDLLRSLPVHVSFPRWRVQDSPGNGCAGDPPGYPTYFTRCVYTPNGNTPNRGAAMVIRYDGVDYVIRDASDWDAGNALLPRLWKPLPYDHERVQAWVRETYQHHANCYVDDARAVTTKADGGIFVFPVPAYKLRRFVDDLRFSDAWRTAEQAAIAAYNADVVARATAVATPANHSAHRIVARYYPEAAPRLDLIANPPARIDGLWWETEATRPTPETCRPRSPGPHPVNGSWCQWCGWHAATDAAATDGGAL